MRDRMPDREKVIQWLEACSVGCEEGCPYEYDGLVHKVECKADLMRDALELLEEQEPIRPKIVHDPVYSGQVWRCGNCNVLIVKDPYCPKCGRKVKWDA